MDYVSHRLFPPPTFWVKGLQHQTRVLPQIVSGFQPLNCPREALWPHGWLVLCMLVNIESVKDASIFFSLGEGLYQQRLFPDSDILHLLHLFHDLIFLPCQVRPLLISLTHSPPPHPLTGLLSPILYSVWFDSSRVGFIVGFVAWFVNYFPFLFLATRYDDLSL